VDLSAWFSVFDNFEYKEEIHADPLLIHVRPYSYSEITKTSIKTLEQQRIFAIVNDENMGDEEKLERFGKSFVKLTELTVDLIAECISQIDTPDGSVTDKQMITEFIHNCNKDLFETISKHVVSMKDQIELKSHIWSAYTFESTLFTDIPKLARLLKKWLLKKDMNIDINILEDELQTNYSGLITDLKTRYDNETLKKRVYEYKNLRDKLKTIFQYDYINTNDIDLKDMLRNHVKNCLDSGNLFKLMTKDDVETVISATLQPHGVSFDVKTEFIELIEQVDISLWFDEWNFLKSI
jgi:hypothetical protein